MPVYTPGDMPEGRVIRTDELEFAILYWYLSNDRPEHGYLSNFTTHERLRDFNEGLFNALAQLSQEGWQIVHVDPLVNSYPPQQRLVWLQRRNEVIP